MAQPSSACRGTTCPRGWDGTWPDASLLPRTVVPVAPNAAGAAAVTRAATWNGSPSSGGSARCGAVTWATGGTMTWPGSAGRCFSVGMTKTPSARNATGS